MVSRTCRAQSDAGFQAEPSRVLTTLATALGVTPATLSNNPATGNLAQLRNAAGLSQDTAARRAGLVRTTYAALERGETATLDPHTAQQLAEALGVDPKIIHSAHSISRANHLQRPH